MIDLKEILSAVYQKRTEFLDRLNREEVNLKDDDGRSPLIHALLAENPDLAVIETLIKKGANVNVQDKDQKWTPLHFAARDQNEPAVELLLRAGADVDPLDVFGNTPLWRCVMSSKSEIGIIKKLIEYNADPEKKNNSGISPLDLAIKIGRHDIVSSLRKNNLQ